MNLLTLRTTTSSASTEWTFCCSNSIPSTLRRASMRKKSLKLTSWWGSSRSSHSCIHTSVSRQSSITCTESSKWTKERSPSSNQNFNKRIPWSAISPLSRTSARSIKNSSILTIRTASSRSSPWSGEKLTTSKRKSRKSTKISFPTNRSTLNWSINTRSRSNS